MRKFFGTGLLVLVIGMAVVMVLDLGGLRTSISARTGWFRLDTAAAEQAARTVLGSIDRQAKTLTTLGGAQLDEKTAASLATDPHVTLYERLPGDYLYIYDAKTTTGDLQCTLEIKTSSITC